jgi:transposase
MEGMPLLQSGMSQSQVARALNVSRQSVSRWAQAFGSEGMEGLQKKAKQGLPPKLTNEQKKRTDRVSWKNDWSL